MEIREFKDEDLKDYEIVNESGSTRKGFYHRSTLLKGGVEIETDTVNYLNRTWESYEFQSCMCGVVRKAKEHWEDYYLAKFKNENSISRMTAKRKEEFEKYLAEIEIIDTYNTMLTELSLYSY